MESFRLHRGFSLIELLVVLSIIMVLTFVVLTTQSSFNKTLVLSNTAYDIALSIRTAETYGLGSRTVTGVSQRNVGHGIRFDISQPNRFVFFADSTPAASASNCHGLPPSDAGGATSPAAQPGDCIYQAGSDVAVKTYTIENNITITNFCTYTSGTPTCTGSGGVTTLDVVFSRPNPDAFISKNGSYSFLSPITQACITLSSPYGATRTIVVGAAGHIAVNTTPCP
jgi:prepilin-type N-terminal cleavage/methylation domain-containing protein